MRKKFYCSNGIIRHFYSQKLRCDTKEELVLVGANFFAANWRLPVRFPFEKWLMMKVGVEIIMYCEVMFNINCVQKIGHTWFHGYYLWYFLSSIFWLVLSSVIKYIWVLGSKILNENKKFEATPTFEKINKNCVFYSRYFIYLLSQWYLLALKGQN